ncbi:MAG: isoprenylcysteine carboxyl methyltransferase [uncultured bacterium]|nr:MAG: isoprenylcysteine carboxyl methyltransferase [uncultured bacterium]
MTKASKIKSSLVIKVKDYFLAPIIAIAYGAYCFNSESPFWLLFNVSSKIILVGMIFFIAHLVLKAVSHGFIGDNWSRLTTIYQGHVLIREGPYRLVRHPIYLSYLLGALSVLFLSGSIVLFVLSLLYFILNAMRANDEEKYLLLKFGSEYEKYTQETGKFFPKLKF